MEQLRERFTGRVMADDDLSQLFSDTDHASFVSHALGAQDHRDTLAETHRGRNVQPEHLNALCRHMADSMNEFGMEDAHINSAVFRLAGLHDHIVRK